ncbi:hypothetical protein EDB87DRAFT_1621325 [Lactarius vividus]|nr:hypothetical protein EDB87DRAFT_1621325 [Lactarius vividus]
MSLNLNNHHILPLPDELISYILEHTDFKAVIACRRSCRRLKDIVDDSSALQYLVELSAARMCDGAPSAVGPAERLTRLQKAQTAWKSSSWSPVDHFPYSKEMSPFPVTASGNLIAFRSDRSRMGELLMLRFPSDLRDIPEQLWYLDLDCDRLESICLDDTQDLLVFSSSQCIHIRTLSTGGVHPLTSTSGTIRPHSDYEAFDLHLHGDLLSFVGTSHILVWNWKTGDRLAEIPLTTSAPCCAFLDDRHIIFTHYNPTREPRTISFQVTTLPSSDNAGPSPPSSYRFALDLPMHSPPYFTELHVNTPPPCPVGAYGRGLFYPDPRHKLLALEVGAITVEGFTAVFTLHTLYVPHDAFLSYIAAHPAPAPPQQPGDPLPIDVPWEAWGPGHTRLVTVPNVAHSRYLGLYKVCGMQALSEPPILLDDGILCIMDYLLPRAPPPAEPRDGGAHDEHALPLPVSPNGSATEPRASGSSGDGAVAEHEELQDVPPPPTPPDTSIPYSRKDVPLPKELGSDSVRCVLCEDVVVLFEFSVGNPERPSQRIDRMFYHPI